MEKMWLATRDNWMKGENGVQIELISKILVCGLFCFYAWEIFIEYFSAVGKWTSKRETRNKAEMTSNESNCLEKKLSSLF